MEKKNKRRQFIDEDQPSGESDGHTHTLFTFTEMTSNGKTNAYIEQVENKINPARAIIKDNDSI